MSYIPLIYKNLIPSELESLLVAHRFVLLDRKTKKAAQTEKHKENSKQKIHKNNQNKDKNKNV